jgi:shikimate dehydrogenase
MAIEKLPKAGVIGWPVEHSLSPSIHRYWLDHYKIEGAYDPLPVSPDHIEETLHHLERLGIVGANVTLPFKEMAYRACARVDEGAEKLKSVNTLWLDKGQLCGTNTDGYGFMAYLDQIYPHWDQKDRSVLIIGAGGATRAIVGALLDRGQTHIHLVNRTKERADKLNQDFEFLLKVHALDDVDTLISQCNLVINTSSMGLNHHNPLHLNWSRASKDTLAYDIVYKPLDTVFLKDARQAGLATLDGLGMLLHQAVPGFERWFGVRPQVTNELHEHILAQIAR